MLVWNKKTAFVSWLYYSLTAEQLNNKIAGAKLEIIKMAGHEANVDNSKELAEIIRNFWK